MTAPEIEALRRELYREPDDLVRLVAELPNLGDCIAAQLAELARNPSRDRCDRVLANLEGLKQHVRRISAAQEVSR